MTRDEFEQQLLGDGFATLTEIIRAPNDGLAEHTHPFEARALILRGEITLEVAGRSTRYAVGDVFHLAREEAHGEQYGPEGVHYLVGRR